MHVRGYKRLVWLKVMSARARKFIPRRERRRRFLRLVYSIARREGVPPELVLAVIETESDFHRYAVSPVGAQGYMQVMPFWPRLLGLHGVSLFDTRANLVLGCAILHYYISTSRGDLPQALQRYFGHADGYVYSGHVLTLLADRWYWR
jgi:soluble lytic murein transglycosylase-like protein